MEKVYRCNLDVRGYELDSFGHVNNAVYLNYLEVARWKMLNEEGITHAQIAREKLWPVIASIEIKYLRPSFMNDTLEIRSKIVEYGKARFMIEQKIFRDETVIAAAKVQSVVINESGRPVEIPSYYHRLWT